MKKILFFLSSLTLTASSSTIVVSCNLIPKEENAGIKGEAEEEKETTENKVDLNEVLTNKNLGEISDNSDETILNAIIAKNSQIEIIDLEIKAKNETNAEIVVKSGSLVYLEDGDIFVNFSIAPPVETLKNLSAVLLITELGEISDNSSETILNVIKQKNSDILINEIEISGTISETEALVSVKETSTKYVSGESVKVTFSIAKIPLSKILTNTQLGELPNNNVQTILDAIAQTNSLLDINEVEIKDAPSKTEAVVLVKESSTKYILNQSVSVTFTIKKIELSSVLVNTDLGEIANNESETILITLKSLNPKLEISEIEIIGEPSRKEATVSVKEGSQKYINDTSIKVSFTIKKDELSSVLIITNLEEITNNDEATILQKIKLLNSNLYIDELELIGEISKTSATVSVKSDSDRYINGGNVKVSFTIEKISLDSVLKTTNLNEISDNSHETILNAIADKNNLVHINEIEIIGEPSRKEATVSVKSDSDTYIKGGSLKVSFTIKKIGIDQILINKNLGELQDNDSQTILDAVSEKNPDLVINEVELIGEISRKEATVSVKSESDRYINGGNVKVIFTIKRLELSSVLVNTNLGEIENNDSQTILNAVSEKNSNLYVNEVEITGNSSRKEATVSVKSDSERYEIGNSLKVTFTIKRLELSSVLVNTNLGEIENNDSQTILNAVSEKNPNLYVNEVEITGNSTRKEATVSVKSDSEKYEIGNSLKVSFTIKRLELSSVLVNTDLGELKNNDLQTIMNAISEKNSNLDINEVEIIENPTKEEATVSVKSDSDKYVIGDSLKVTFTLEKVYLSSVLINTDLGEINDFNESTILDAIKNKNNDVIISEIEITGNSSNSEAKVSVKSDSKIYISESIKLSFTIKNAITLKSVLVNTDLGELQDNGSQTILNAVSEKNSNLDINEVEIIQSPSRKEAIISVKNSSLKYLNSSVKVIFTITKIELSSVLVNTNLGEIKNYESTTILEALKLKNSNLNINEIEIIGNSSNSSATVSVKSDSEFYLEGSINVSYTIIGAINIETILKTVSIGEVNEKSAQNILNAAKIANKDLIIEDLEVINIKENSALISVKNSSLNYVSGGSVEITFTTGIQSVIKTTSLGQVAAANKLTIIAKLKLLNMNLNTNEIDVINITKKEADVTVKPSSKVYTNNGLVHITYRTLL